MSKKVIQKDQIDYVSSYEELEDCQNELHILNDKSEVIWTVYGRENIDLFFKAQKETEQKEKKILEKSLTIKNSDLYDIQEDHY